MQLVAGEGQQPVGGDERGERQADRQQRGDQAPKATSRMPSASGTAVHSALREVLAEHLAEPLVGARLAELVDLDAVAAVLGPHLLHGVEDRLDPVRRRLGLALHLEVQQARRAVLRKAPAAATLLHLAGGLDRRGDVGGRLPPAVPGLAGHHDHLAGGLLDAGLLEDLLARPSPRLALGLGSSRPCPSRAAGGRGEDDEQQPADDRRLAVVCSTRRAARPGRLPPRRIPVPRGGGTSSVLCGCLGGLDLSRIVQFPLVRAG